ncbi:unnamed protein product [Owenia fusiformis]|uniref:Uncharacterized protein n=1 Tax=Owenia fusiformis TaxID=6347 RepID=A0A8J1XP49_OWEFU|nr:unnamed protein product [Owenia fusiformis]
MKPYKVQNCNGTKRVGVVASDLHDLIKKGQQKLKIRGRAEQVRAVLEDGTEVDDDEYFYMLPPHTVFYLLPLETSFGYALLLQTLFDHVSKASGNKKLQSDITDFIEHGDGGETKTLMMEFVNQLSNRDTIHAEDRKDHEDWFEGTEKRFKSKDSVMRYSAERRVRGYLRTAQEEVNKAISCKSQKAQLDAVMENFKERLRENKYHGTYFSRKDHKHADSMCDEFGWFRCEGAYDEDSCDRIHRINPYGDRDSRVLFSTWNLDHVIEKSREILPSLVNSAGKVPKDKQINWQYFYNLLFTRDNLKLVHIVCHKKEEHSTEKCDEKRFYSKK